MTFTEFLLKAIGKIKPIKRLSQSLCRYAVSKPSLRKQLNILYNRLTYNERVFFHYLFASIFRNRVSPSINGVWNVKFNNKVISLPLRTETLWLDWDLAVSIVGHDVEIKSFYEEFINTTRRPVNFFDIGANYGTHSLLFLSQGIQAITFEPNPECKPIFMRFLELNSLKGQLENVAVGEKKSAAELVFPKNDTWNGSLQADYQQELSNYNDLISIKVEIITLDDYVSEYNIRPDIIKIDTEGFELNVLQGARKTLMMSHPVVVFESNKPTERTSLFNELNSAGYSIYNLENFFLNRQQINQNEFVHSKQVNFVGFKGGNELLK